MQLNDGLSLVLIIKEADDRERRILMVNERHQNIEMIKEELYKPTFDNIHMTTQKHVFFSL